MTIKVLILTSSPKQCRIGSILNLLEKTWLVPGTFCPCYHQ